MSKILSFELVCQVQAVQLREKSGTIRKYELRELNGAQRDQYMEGLSKRMTFDAEGKPVSMNSIAGLQSSLIVASLFDENGQPVSKEVVESWPATTTQGLYDAAQKLSGLDRKREEAEKAAKKD